MLGSAALTWFPRTSPRRVLRTDPAGVVERSQACVSRDTNQCPPVRPAAHPVLAVAARRQAVGGLTLALPNAAPAILGIGALAVKRQYAADQ